MTSSAGLEAVGFISTKYANQTDDWPDMEFMLTSSSTPSDGGLQVKIPILKLYLRKKLFSYVFYIRNISLLLT